MNAKYGFGHWDLHFRNIFVDNNNLSNIKIYDFDYSEISNPNHYIAKNNLLLDHFIRIY